MQFKADASVFTADGKEVGQLERVVIEPKTKEVTHIVIRKGLITKEERLIPIDRVERATEDGVTLREDTDPLEAYPMFEATAYIRVPQRPARGPEPALGYPSSVYPYTPVGPLTMQYSGYPVTASSTDKLVEDVHTRNIPEDTVALKEGAKVVSEDGEHVGNIERVYVHSEGGQATHFMISQGILFKERKIVPASWIDRVTEDEVWLAVGKDILEQVPDHREKDTPGGYV
jgi:uncharacterized protein YrrD